jgi:hypothetical protein
MNHSKFLYTVALALTPQFCLAQQLALNSSVDAMDSATATPSSVSAVAASTVAPSEKPLTGRWLDLETLSHSERYRNAFQVGGGHNFDNAQQRSLIVGKIKLDAEGRYDIGFRASSGRYFNWAFSNFTGQGFVARGNKPSSANFYTSAESSEVLSSVFADPAGAQVFLGTAGQGGFNRTDGNFTCVSCTSALPQ